MEMEKIESQKESPTFKKLGINDDKLATLWEMLNKLKERLSAVLTRATAPKEAETNGFNAPAASELEERLIKQREAISDSTELVNQLLTQLQI